MAITVKHAKTDNIADWTQPTLDAQIAAGNYPGGTVLNDIVLPSDWNANLTTSMATNKLVGRGTAGTGSFEEITLGTNLSFSGTTLNAASSSATFDAIGSGTNTTAAMVVGTGASLTTSGSGSVVATSITSRTIGGVAYDGTANITVASATGGFAVSGGNMTVAGTDTITSTSASAFAVGANGATNPVLNINANTGSQVGGITIVGAVTGGTTTITATDSGSNHGLSISSKAAANLTLTTGATGNSVILAQNGSARVTSNNANLSLAYATRAGTATAFFLFSTGASTTLTASTNAPLANWNFANSVVQQHATGALTLQTDFRIQQATHTAVGATTITDCATFGVDGPSIASTNATITNASAIYTGGTAVSGTVTNSYGANINASSGATNNYAARFNGMTQLDVPSSAGAIGPATPAFNSGYSSTAVGDLVYLDSSTTWQKADNSTSTATKAGMLGIALTVTASGSPAIVALSGSFIFATAWNLATVGAPVYMGTAAGLTLTAPTTTDTATRVIGWVVASGNGTTKIWFQPSPDYITHT